MKTVLVSLVLILLGAALVVALTPTRFVRDSTSVIDMRDDDVLSKIDVIRDTNDQSCRAIYRWFTGTGGATVLGVVPCAPQQPPPDDPPLGRKQ